MIDRQASKRIVECAFEVHKFLGNGMNKGVYQNALSIELADNGFSHVRNETITVHYKSHPTPVGKLVADFIVNDAIMVDVMNKKEINELDHKCFRRKMHEFGIAEGLLINFESRNISFKRVT